MTSIFINAIIILVKGVVAQMFGELSTSWEESLAVLNWPDLLNAGSVYILQKYPSKYRVCSGFIFSKNPRIKSFNVYVKYLQNYIN